MSRHVVGSDHPELNDEANAIWDRIAGPWDDESGEEGSHLHRYVIDPISDRLLALSPGDVVLDIACGGGRYARRMAEKGTTVVGADQSTEFLRRAVAVSEQTGIDVEFKRVDATDYDQLIALGEETFDAINCTMGVMNMASLTPLARALPKLLRPKGRFVFTISHPVFARNNVRFAVEQDPSWGQQRHTITTWDYLDAAPDMGIGVRNQPEKQYFFDRPTGLLLNVFFENGLVMPPTTARRGAAPGPRPPS